MPTDKNPLEHVWLIPEDAVVPLFPVVMQSAMLGSAYLHALDRAHAAGGPVTGDRVDPITKKTLGELMGAWSLFVAASDAALKLVDGHEREQLSARGVTPPETPPETPEDLRAFQAAQAGTRRFDA